MTIKRIVANIATDQIKPVRDFYIDMFGLDVAMDLDWIVTLATGEVGSVQLSIATHGGSGTPVPDLSIEVDDLDAVHARAKKRGAPIPYPLTQEPWGVRRFYVQDPAGKVLNVLEHQAQG